MTQRFWYTMDRGGVTAILKSAPVKTLLQQEAESIAGYATAQMHSNYPRSVSSDGYSAEVKDLTYTSIGYITPVSPIAVKDGRENHTLDSFNH